MRAYFEVLAATVSLAALGCSVGGDVPIGSDVPTLYFVSPEGSDLNPGTRAQPWYSLSFAVERLRPGHTLLLAPGEYTPATTGLLAIDCGDVGRSGRPGAPITVRAEVERSAMLRGDGEAVPLRMLGCAHWAVEGLVLTNEHDNNVKKGLDVGSGAVISLSHDVSLRRLLLRRSNNTRHSHLLRVLESKSVLVEECEAYDFYHNAFEAVQTEWVTFRRNYLHSRLATSGGYPVAFDNPTRGEVGIQIEESSYALLENNFAEVVGNGFSVVGRNLQSTFAEPAPFALVGARLIGNLTRDALGFGFRIESRCDETDPCEAPERLVTDTLVADGVVFEAAGGVSVNAAPGTRIENSTAAQVSHGFHLFRGEGNSGARYAANVARSVARGFSGVGFWAESVDEWAFESCAAQAAQPKAVAFRPADDRVVQPVESPDDDACVAYRGANSSLGGLAGASPSLGANVISRTLEGVLTAEPLWDLTTGSFPCGAVVAGINDDPSQSCIGAHERFRIATPECPLPYPKAP